MQEPQKLFNRDFMIQWQGQSVSRLGSQVFAAAMIFWIKHATGSASIMGLLSLISGLPAVLLTPIGGAVADRYSRRKIIIIGDLIRGVSLALLALLMFWRPDAVTAILAGLFFVSVINGVAGSFFGPAISATIPDLVPSSQVNAANSMGQLSAQVAMFIGQGLGGVLYRIIGAPVLFLVNGLSFLYSSGSEVFVNIPQVIPERKGTLREQFRVFGQDIAEGFRFVWQKPGLRELVLLSALLSFFGAPIIMLMPFYVEDTLGVRPDWYGFILAAFGVGTMLGYLLAGILRLNSASRARLLMVFALLTPAGYVLLGLARTPMQALVLATLGGLVGGYVTVYVTTLVQLITPTEIRGRVVGLLAALSSALTPIAMGLSGVVADMLNQNIRLIYVLCGGIVVLAGLALTLLPAYRQILAFDIPAGNLRRDERPGTTGAGDPPQTPRRALATRPETHERTRTVYEHIEGYPKAAPGPIPQPEELDQILTELGQPRGSRARAITDASFRLVGMKPFLTRLSAQHETLARQYNARLPGLYAPVTSTTLALADDPRPLAPLERAATLILAVCEYQAAVFSAQIPPDTCGGEPLEMGQYPGFFATSQIIHQGRIQVFKSDIFSRVNVVVGNQFFILDLAAADRPVTSEALVATLSDIVSAAEPDAEAGRVRPPLSPGLVSAADVPRQLRAFRYLHQDSTNRASLEALKHTLFTLCLDLHDQPASPAEAARVAHSHNPHNRWFHASLQVVVFGNARACAICNFSTYLDGNMMVRGAAEIQRRAAAMPVNGASVGPLPYTALAWRIPLIMLDRAAVDRERVLDSQPATFELPGYGQDFFTARAVEPAAGFAAALQMAANKLIGRPARMSQIVPMSRYRCTDPHVVGVSRPEMLAFADAMTDGRGDPDAAAALLQKAIAAQTAAIREECRYLPLPIIANLLVRSRAGVARLLTSGILTVRRAALAKLGLLPQVERDVLISELEALPEVPAVGRPGARLPYVTCFGLHYQMLPDRTVLTLMPALGWQKSNQETIAALCESLDRMRRVLERAEIS